MLVCFVLPLFFTTAVSTKAASYQPSVTFNAGVTDQDDMAVWVHPTDSSKSLIIGSDKTGLKVVVYDINGTALQTLSDVGKPGNIDLRYNFPFGGSTVDIVAFNDRGGNIIRVYKIGADQKSIERIDDGTISQSFTNYGFGLYVSPVSRKFYGFTTEDNGGKAAQFELKDAGNGKVNGTEVRQLSVGSQSEGVVADDLNKTVYIGREACCILKFDAEPTGGSTSLSVADIGSATALTADIEGLTIYHTGAGAKYLIASSQGSSTFVVFDLPGMQKLSSFSISGASSTDGIDVSPVALGAKFPQGVFLAHSGGAAFYGTPWNAIASAEGLTIDTTWNPRLGASPQPSTSPSPVASVSPSPSSSVQPSTTPQPSASPGVLILQPGDEGVINCAADVLEQVGFNATQTQLDLFCRRNTGGGTNVVTLNQTQSAAFDCPTGVLQHTRSADGKTVDIVCVADPGNNVNLQVGESAIVNCSGTSLAVNLNTARTQADALCTSQTGTDSFVFGFKLQGLTAAEVIIPVNVTFVSTVNAQTLSTTANFISDASGVLKPQGGSLALPVGVADGNAWSVYVKTDVSLRKLLGNQTFSPGQTTAPLTWSSQTAKVGDFVNSIKQNVINLQDVASILAVYTQLTVPVSPAVGKFDINYDRQIDLLDIATVLSNYTALEVPGD